MCGSRLGAELGLRWGPGSAQMRLDPNGPLGVTGWWTALQEAI